MTPTTTPRRFQRLYEQVLLSRTFSLLFGWALTVILPAVVFWSWERLLHPNSGQKTALIVTSIAFALSHLSLSRLYNIYPGRRAGMVIAPQVTMIYSLIILATLLTRIEVSRYLLLTSGASALIWLHMEYILTQKYFRLKLAVIPNGKYTEEIIANPCVDARPLAELTLGEHRYDGVVADFRSIDADTQRFLTQCALRRIPVYDARQIYESVTGRVKIHRMSENNMGALLPSPTYERIKFCIDVLIVIMTLPLTLPAALITALLIRLESPGPVIYTQPRIGRGNRPFTMYKFRSMRFDSQATEQFADENDPRITRVGKVIRKLRIDELPQFLNVLKNEMSLIGPRPEQPSFVEEYDSKIPFYSYRHVVKPGISGWAQVRHGYTDSAGDTQVKIEHDFYYIKNCSLALDFVIVILTVKTMLTGFGAR